MSTIRPRFLLLLGLMLALTLSVVTLRRSDPVPLDASPSVHAAMGALATMDVDAATDEAPQPKVARTRFTFHMYVDPIYGDDIKAAAQSPRNTGTTIPLPLMTSGYSGGPPGYLQHAPYSFQTVNRALIWINGLTGTGTGLPLPWKYPQENRWIDYIVIHCLPGLYGPKLVGQPVIDARSGLPWNGETFPLALPPRVSIQGTSALDTIFDARQDANGSNIFEIGSTTSNLDPTDWIHTFIDSITLRGARDDPPSGGRLGAGVLIFGNYPVEATISNCFFTNNIVGVGMWEDKEEAPHSPRIVNNTFAWNEVGVYSGSSVSPDGVIGTNVPMLLNNVFDVSTPSQYQSLGYLMGVSAFEGIDSTDRTVQSRLGVAVGFDFNSYEIVPTSGWVSRLNVGDTMPTPPYTWPRTQSRNTSQTYAPRVDLYPFTQTPIQYMASGQWVYATARGALYINDIFRMDPALPMIAIHDYRQAPTAIRGDTQARTVNPMIGMGIDLGHNGTQPVHIGNITMQNGTFTSYSPGLPPIGVAGSAEDLVVLNCWDFDADGAFNPRVEDRRYGASPTPYGRVDIGADESAEVTISGYVESTRTFSQPHSSVAPNTVGLMGGTSVYFFNLYHGVGNQNNTYWRYESNFSMDLVYTTPHQRPSGTEWYNQIITNPYGTGSNYTNGRFDNRAVSTTVLRPRRDQWISTPPFQKKEFMRNLFCDIAPHLQFDFPPVFSSGFLNPAATFPHWGEYILFGTNPTYQPYPLYDDIFQSNPWHLSKNTVFGRYDNLQLFNDPTTLTGATWPLTSIVRPPLTFPRGTWSANNKSYLLSNQLHATWLFEYPNNNAWTYTVNSYGWAGPDFPPYQYQWHGVRYNCQLLAPNDPGWTGLRVTNNLQTFLVVEGIPVLPMALSSSKGSASKSSQITSYTHPDRDIYPGSKIYKPLMKAFREFLRKKKAGK